MMTNADLTLNVLKFNFVNTKLSVAVGIEKTNNCLKFSRYDKEKYLALLGYAADSEELYYYPQEKPASCKMLELACKRDEQDVDYWSFSFLKLYYTQQLSDYFRRLQFPVKNNFVSDTDVWVACPSPFALCDGYRNFSLRVQFVAPEYEPELVIIASEVHSVYQKSVSDAVFSETSTDKFNWVLFRKNIYRYNEMPDEAQRHQNEVFPCLSFELMAELKIQRPAPDTSNRYPKYLEQVNAFKSNYLKADALAGIMCLEQEWKKVSAERLSGMGHDLLQFGNGQHAEPKYGVKLYGPKEIVKDEVVFFFIMHCSDIPLAYTINDYLKGDKTAFKGGLNGFLGFKYTTAPMLSIVFDDIDNPIVEVKEKLIAKSGSFESGKRYVAIYLSPYSKYTYNARHKKIYFQIKELLLQHGIVSQTIDANKVWGKERKCIETADHNIEANLQTVFRFSLPNILVAIQAKLGATPWCFEQQASKELVIGISAYKSKELDSKYLGSAFSFTNEGRFQGFELFREKQIAQLAGSIALAVKEYSEETKNLERLVIHFYKRLGWRELKPIENALGALNLNIPVVVVSINKSFSDDIVGFDLSSTHNMPLSGLYFPINKTQYLLYNNQLSTGNENINPREGFPFPLKISIQKYLPGSHDYVFAEKAEVEALLYQVCRFSQLYWKSVSRQWIPVTLRYPEMLAQIAPHFAHKDLTGLGRSSLWFL